MDGNKLEISGKTGSDSPPAFYKPIPEKDMEDEALSRPKSLIKVKSSAEVDGADERMLPNDEKEAEVVVYVNNEKSPQNGDAKLDIGDIKSAFVGMTKEELMRYSNDPFWIKLRWFLFITFWALWAAMLIGAILIIYAAPKCDPPPPRTWWQQGPLTEIKPDTKPEALKLLDKNIQGLIVNWPEDTYAGLDDKHEIINLIKTAKEEGTKVIIDLDPVVSNVWFEKSESKDPVFAEYYIWHSGKNLPNNSTTVPPNNWISSKNVSSWKYSQARKEFYYSPFEKPHLNFRNRLVVDEFNKVIEIFLAANASGIRLRNAAHLLVDNKFDNEPVRKNTNPNQSNYDHTQHGFYIHSKTENLEEIGELLKEWRKIIRNKTEDGPFMIAEELGKVESYRVNETLVVDLPLQSHIFAKPTLLVNETANSLNQTFNIDKIEWPLWKVNTNAVPKDVLDIITYLLPGAPLVNASDTVNSALLKVRRGLSIMRGICGVYKLQNDTVLSFIRVTPGSPGILVAVNPTDERAVVNFPAEIPPLEKLSEVTVRLYSNNFNETSFMDINGKREAAAVPISPKSALVLEYVPKHDE